MCQVPPFAFSLSGLHAGAGAPPSTCCSISEGTAVLWERRCSPFLPPTLNLEGWVGTGPLVQPLAELCWCWIGVLRAEGVLSTGCL